MASSTKAGFLQALKLLGLCVYGGCVCNIVSNHLIVLFKCEEKSMYPTINKTSRDDYVIVEMISKSKGLLKKSDVVILRQPTDPQEFICKRITCVAGDNIPIDTLTSTTSLSVVPRGHVWLEGDNRLLSHDSRIFGPVPLALIVGRVMLRVWPPSQFGKIS